MTLSAPIRKRDTGNLATAIPATPPKVDAATVAKIATVAVANPHEQTPQPLDAAKESAIRAWLKRIQEDDPVVIDEVIEKCRLNPADLSYFLTQARR